MEKTMQNRTKQERWEQYDGLRLYASLLIVASHSTALGMTGQGGLMVAFFFALSGFFMTMPMQQDGEARFLQARGWLRFYVMRLVRILPVYWGTLLAVYWLSDTIFETPSALLENMLFFNCRGHLWYIQQEMICYLLVPAVLGGIALLKKHLWISNAAIAVLLAALAPAAHLYFRNVSGFRPLGNGSAQMFRFGLFLAGMSAGYFCKALGVRRIRTKAAACAADLAELLLLLAAVFSSAYYLAKWNPALENYYVGWEHPMLAAAAAGVLLVLLAANSGGWTARLLAHPAAVRFGRASFGIYLTHYFLLTGVSLSSNLKNFCLTALLAACLSLVSYELLEEPLARWCRRRF